MTYPGPSTYPGSTTYPSGGSAAPSRLVAVGLAAEPSYGATAAPTSVLPWTTLNPQDSNTILEDTSWRGSAVTTVGHETGVLESKLSLAGPVYPDSIGHLLAGILGDLTFTSGSPNTWAMSVLNTGTQQPNSYTVSLSDEVGLLQWPGCVVSQLQLDYTPDGLLTWTATMNGQPSTVPGSLTLPALSSEIVMPGWRSACQVGGITEPRLLTASVQFARAVTAKRNVTGQQAPWLQRLEGLAVTGKFDVAIGTDTYRAVLLAGSSTSLDLNYQTGSGASARQLRVHCSQIALAQAARSYGQRWVEVSCSFTADATTADAGASGGLSPVKVTLQNAVPSGGYP